MQAFINEEKLPANIARPAYFKKKSERDGAYMLIVAIMMPIVPKLAKPQMAYVAITIDLSLCSITLTTDLD